MHITSLLSKTRTITTIHTMLMAIAIPAWAAGAPSTTSGNVPSLAAVKAVVSKTLAERQGYRAGDLISQKQVASVVSAVKAAGWDVPKSAELKARAPADDEFLVRALSTEKGIAFMRSISALSGGYDRVDRLSRLPQGRQLVEQLINGPDGYKLIGYLTDSRGGAELGVMLDRTPQGTDFNKPTGRIYTERQLLAELERLYAAAK